MRLDLTDATCVCGLFFFIEKRHSHLKAGASHVAYVILIKISSFELGILNNTSS